MIYASAEALSTALTQDEVDSNWLYPNVSRIREVSAIVARGVIRAAQADGVDRELALRNLSEDQLNNYVRERMYDPFLEKERVTEEIREITAGLEGLLAGGENQGASPLVFSSPSASAAMGNDVRRGGDATATAGVAASDSSASTPPTAGGRASSGRPADLLSRISTSGPSTGREAHGEAMTVQWSRGQ